MKSIITLVVLAGISAGVFALGSFRKGDDDKSLLHIAEELAINVQVAKPEQREVIRVVQAPGDVEAVLEVDISSEIVSKIEEMPVEEGDFVKQGDLLCRLNDEFLRAAVESGQARVASLIAAVSLADADVEKADRDLNRQIRWSENNVTTVQEMLDFRTTSKKAAALLTMRQQELIDRKRGEFWFRLAIIAEGKLVGARSKKSTCRNSGPPAQNTVRSTTRAVKAIFSWARSNDMLRVDPFQDFLGTNVKGKPNPYVPLDQVQRLIEVAPPPWRAMFALCRMAGLRRSEALGLT